MNKEIYLKKLIIRNFKGIRNLEINFNQQETVIAGENGTGKTTVLDAFLWLLFGKDSTGRSDSNFNIKTLDENGDPILKEDHEVTGILSVAGKDVSLRRRYREKWGSGSDTGKLSHFTEFYLNDVKLGTKREYDTEVSAIIPEEVFKMITNPFYFNTRPAADQKSMLLEMAGDVTDDDVKSLKPEFAELLDELAGKNLAVYNTEINAKKKAIKDELKQLPARIDTAKQLMPVTEDWAKLEKEMKAKKTKIANLDEQIADKSKLVEAEYKRKSDIQKEIGEKKLVRSQLENTIRSQANDANNVARSAINQLTYDIQVTNNDIARKNEAILSINSLIQTTEVELDILRGQYRNISAEELQYPEGAFECPTCKRPLEADDIEAKQAEFQANFNETKSKRLQKNKEEGLGKTTKKNELQKQKEKLLAEIKELEDQSTTLTGQKKYQEENLPSAKEPSVQIESNEDWIKLGNEISELENQLNVESVLVDVSELKSTKSELENEIQDINKRLAKRETIEKTEKLIKELEESEITNNQALSDLERKEHIAKEFQKAKDNELMKRINSMFQMVSFSFVDKQLNGEENITCVCTVDGTPYPDVNNAGKINAGIDVINAICRCKGVTAPIFIDNRESVNTLIPTQSQVINLVVSKHPALMIKMPGYDPIEMFQEL